MEDGCTARVDALGAARRAVDWGGGRGFSMVGPMGKESATRKVGQAPIGVFTSGRIL